VGALNPSLLLLILVWVVILLPGALRSRLRPSPRASVGGFQRAMDGLRTDAAGAPTTRTGATPVGSSAVGATPVGTTPPGVRRDEDPVVARRRRRALTLLAATVVSVAAAPLVGGPAWVVAGTLVGASLAAVVVLRRLKLQRDAARDVLVSLDLRRPAQPLVDEITGELVVAAGTSATVVRLPSWRG